jgi:hypothetical protein
LAGVNVAQITSGVHTLGTSLDAINRAFSELLTRIHTVSREFGLRGLPAPGGHAVASARGITNVGR